MVACLEVGNWTTQLCMALDYVHSLKIVHRDVKGSNLFITGMPHCALLHARIYHLNKNLNSDIKFLLSEKSRKRGGVQKSMGNKAPWKTGMLINLPVTFATTHFPAERSILSPCNFATTHLTACILNCYLPLQSVRNCLPTETLFFRIN